MAERERTSSAAETEALGERIAEGLEPGIVLAQVEPVQVAEAGVAGAEIVQRDRHAEANEALSYEYRMGWRL